MKIIACVVLLFATGGLAAQNAEQRQVNQSLVKLFDALAALDMGTIRALSAPDFMVLESGVVWNLDTVAQKIEGLKGVAFSRTNHLDFVQTEIKGNVAWTVYHNQADLVINGLEDHRRWLESAVLIKEHGTWKVRLLHSTILKPKK